MLFTPNPTMTHVPMESPVVVDKASFQQFVRARETAVYTFCYRTVGNAHLAETIAQKAFLDVCSRFPAVSLADVLGAARCRCWALLRQGDDYGRETAVTNNQALFNSFALPEREVLALYYGCQLRVDEIAIILDCSVATVRAMLLQARRHAIDLLPHLSAEQP